MKIAQHISCSVPIQMFSFSKQRQAVLDRSWYTPSEVLSFSLQHSLFYCGVYTRTCIDHEKTAILHCCFRISVQSADSKRRDVQHFPVCRNITTPSKLIITAIQLIFAGVNMFWALPRVILNLVRWLGLKWHVSRDPKHIYAREHKLFSFY